MLLPRLFWKNLTFCSPLTLNLDDGLRNWEDNGKR